MDSHQLYFQDDSAVKKKGCYLSRCAVLGIILLLIACPLIVGLIVGFLGRQDCISLTSQTREGPVSESGLDNISYRLPRSVFPLHYDLQIRPDLDRLVFDGVVIITLDCKKDTDNVTLNFDGLTLDTADVTITGPSGQVPISAITPIPTHYLLLISLSENLQAGKIYNLTIPYNGVLRNNLMGLYYGTYKAQDGMQRYFAATQFESTRARKALPCFDEPLFKAEFTVTLIRRTYHRCLSNMPSVAVESRGDRWEAERFARSVRMSSYLLAMYVGDLEDAKIDTNLSIEMKVWARLDGIDRTGYVRWVADQQMTYFQRYFNISYALPKMDHVGLPEMGPGAMENYGLIKYRESYVIVDENSTPEAKQASAFIFGHEIGHQWFGNLVTMVWWDDIWLNEGFANLCEYIGVEFVHPEWKPWEQFLFRTMDTAMTLDSLRNSRVIRHDANTPDEISANFDAIAYRKGASILRMIRDTMGHDTFKRGITRYLKKHAFENTVSDDLWASLAEQTEEEGKYINVTKVMHTWTLQMNYPLITVTRDYSSKTALIEQTRFLLDTFNDTKEPEDSESNFGYKWHVPLSYTTQSSSDWDKPARAWMEEDSLKVMDVGFENEWFLANVRRTGVYRVNYDQKNWELLIHQLNTDHTAIPAENRAQIVDDALQLARAGLLDQSLALNATRFLSKEKDLTPWKMAEGFFLLMHEILSRTPIYGAYRRYIVQLVSPLIDELGWEDKGEHLERMLRGTLIRLACLFRHEQCVDYARVMYDRWKEGNITIPASLRQLVYCTAIRDGGEEDWDFAWSKFLEETDPDHRGTLRDALTCASEPWLLARYLDWARDTSKIKRGEADIVLVGIAQNPVGRPIVWQKLQQYWASSDGAIYTKKLIADEAFNGFYTKIDVLEFEEFRDKYDNDHGNAKHLIYAAVEKAWVSYRWMSNSLREMGDWFEEVTRH